MKLISLNTFSATFFEPFMQFVKQHAADTDIFCFQEVFHSHTGEVTATNERSNQLEELIAALPEFNYYFAPVQENFAILGDGGTGFDYGNATFIKKNLNVVGWDKIFIYREANSYVHGEFETYPSNMLHTQIMIGSKIVTVCNLHGAAMPGHKLDTVERLLQTKKILDFVRNEPGEKIIVGDFNLLPETRSIKLIEENGFRNLIQDFGITTTRGSLIKKLHPEYGTSAQGFQEFADYAFVSPGVVVTSFEVPDLPVSDHLPLILEFEVMGDSW